MDWDSAGNLTGAEWILAAYPPPPPQDGPTLIELLETSGAQTDDPFPLPDTGWASVQNVSHTLDDVIVTEPRDDEWDWESWLFPIPGSGGSGGPVTGGGGGGGELPPDEPPCGGEAPDGPTPEGLSIDDLRDFARSVASQIAALNDNWEWGAVIYVMNGQLFSTTPVTQQDPNNVSISFNGVPTGAHVVAWIHSHTYSYGDPDQDLMSQDDVDARAAILGMSGGRFTVDSALMTYLIDNRRDDLLEFGINDNNRESGQDITPCGGL